MTFIRGQRRLLMSGLLAAVLAPWTVGAQSYPSRDIHFVCAFPAGSGADVLVRHFAEKLRPIVNRAVVVENRVGAGGNIATEYVARSKPDGYTVYLNGASGVAANMHLYKKPPVDAGKAIQIAGTINVQAFMLTVAANSPFKSVGELTAAMRKKGKNATYATSAPNGTVMGEIYKAMTGVEAIEVNYRTGADSLNEITSGKLDYAMLDPVLALAQQREGRLRILSVSSGKRLEASPDIPTMMELGIKMDLTGWWAAMVPSGTPKPVVDQINKWFVQMVSTPETKKFLNSFGGDPYIASADEAQKRFLQTIDDWGDYVRIAKITPQ